VTLTQTAPTGGSLVTLAGSSAPPLTLVHVTNCGPQTFPGSCTIPSTGSGNLIVVGFQADSASGSGVVVSTITDNAGNTYGEAGPARAIDAAESDMVDIWYARNSAAGATSITITPSASASGSAAVIWEFSGANLTAPLDQTAVLNSQSATSTPAGAPVTTTSQNEVVISIADVEYAVTGIASGNTFTSDSTLLENGWAHLVTSSVGTYYPQWNQNHAGTYVSTTASFKAASSGGVTLLTVPASVTVAAGATTATFSATAPASITSNQTATITASLNGSVASTSVTLTGSVQTKSVSGTPASQPSGNAVSSLVCSPNAVTAGGVVTCELFVTARSQSESVELNSSSAQVLIPAFVTTRPNQSSLTFQAQSTSVSTQQPVTITATLGTTEVENTILLMGAAGPVLRVPGRQVARVGTPISFTVSAVDPSSGLPVQVESATSPAGASFDPTTGVFKWIPQASQAGKYRITFTATNSARQSSTAQVELEADSGLPALNSPTSSCSPGATATITGEWLAAPGLWRDPTGASFDLGGTIVAVDGQAVPVLYSSADRVDFLCPATKPGTGTQLSVEVTSPFGSSQPVTIGMVEAVPTILSMGDSPQNQGLISFSGMNDLVMERNFSLPAHPAQPGDEIVILATGLGSAAETSSGTMVVKVSDVYAGVESVQAVPGYAGVYAIQVTVPSAMTFGTVPVQLQMMAPDGHQLNSNNVTATFEAVRY
jgi:uncharacterized protein (TIGR03437 family)